MSTHRAVLLAEAEHVAEDARARHQVLLLPQVHVQVMQDHRQQDAPGICREEPSAAPHSPFPHFISSRNVMMDTSSAYAAETAPVRLLLGSTSPHLSVTCQARPGHGCRVSVSW